MTHRARQWTWWASVVALSLTAGVFCWYWRMDHGLLSVSEAGFVERVAKSAKSGPGALEKTELNPLIRELTASVLGNAEPSEISGFVSALNAASLALLVALFLLLVRPWVPGWMAFLGALGWVGLPLCVGASALGSPGWASALFLVGPALGLALGLRLDGWSLRTIVASLAGVCAGLGILAHPLAPWVAVSLVLSTFLSCPRTRTKSGWVALPALGTEFLGLCFGLAAGFLVAKGMLDAKGQGLLSFFFGYLDGPHPPFTFLGNVYRGGEMGGPPWYTTVWLFFVRTPPSLLLLGLVGAGVSLSRLGKGRLDLGEAWPLWGAAMVLLTASTLIGSPVVPAGLNLLVPLSLAWVALGLWGARQAWNWLETDSRKLRTVGRIALVALLATGSMQGFVASFLNEKMPQAYANALGGGTQAFLLQGNDPLAEMAIPLSTVERLAEEKLKEITVFPWGKTAQRLFQSSELGGRLKARDGGPFPLFHVFAPSSPRSELLPDLLDGKTPVWCEEISGVAMWSYYPKGR